MDMEGKKPYCPVLDVDGVISGGKQFDLDILYQKITVMLYMVL